MYEIKITKLSETSVHVTDDGKVKRVMSNPEEWTNRFNPILIFRDFLKMLDCGLSEYLECMTEQLFKREGIFKYESPLKVDDIINDTLNRKHIAKDGKTISKKNNGQYSFHIESVNPRTLQDWIVTDFEIAVKEVVDNA